MKKQNPIELDFEIDKLTNSIENVITGDSFLTDITLVSKADLKAITKKNDWLFSWTYEMEQKERQVYKLTTTSDLNLIQGLISLEVKTDHVYMHLLENAPFNKGKSKMYAGVAGNLVAFACKISFQQGYQGYVSFISKTELINHYIESLGATHFGGRLMILNTAAALNIISNGN